MPKISSVKHSEFVLIGGGIMSATLAILLYEKFPGKKITIIEKLPTIAQESSEAWNNAGTGHAGNCELNYTPEKKGVVNITKAISISEQFTETYNFWKDCEEKGYINNLSKCISEVPHLSFVRGKKDVAFLEKRYEVIKDTPQFKDMLFSKDKEQIKKWLPLMMEGRADKEEIAATFFEKGYDVNFGEIAEQIFRFLKKQDNVELLNHSNVNNIQKSKRGNWVVTIKGQNVVKSWMLASKYLFIGAGGGTLPLLEKANIKEAKGYGGFPISGLWLRCTNPEIIEKHNAKAYGKAGRGAPPMSVPHMDSRMINGRKELLFGPFAGFTTRFLKHGSMFDLPRSVEFDNIMSLLGAGYQNLPLVKYLIKQVRLSFKDRMEELRAFYPEANNDDWKTVIAGQRVQIIKRNKKGFGKLEFGTEIIISEDKTIAALLGASPGASTSYSVMKEVFDKSFKL
ncbi:MULTISPECIES: malate dehydrogenase (quinone) [unclassified Polaribacter]|uniref:malate dehydrogenase (quinone) n=1 Tax=unclassified Polaribacter TaxID=196858 RepID=UPI001C4FD4B8|nr:MULTISPECIES: malate dehydrogenase (quinone) [unclassified Polaribacter]QXP62439.1 malate dehydrogenase (quinone) [Polaribacter sp. HaHaR_3_91]QXP68189.1 malate dehydrogenase (quinone) [Polaribacter sp. AHE13PA]QXP70365.1 malate dehydrogenase (quinone) [Polaribacter sp. R2A056_3_33]